MLFFVTYLFILLKFLVIKNDRKILQNGAIVFAVFYITIGTNYSYIMNL
jgi:hypothetical protein